MKQWIINLLKKWLQKLDPKIFETPEVVTPVVEPEQPEVEPEKQEEPKKDPGEMKPIEPEISEEDKWNNKWEKADITYLGRILRNLTNTYAKSSLLQTPVDVKAFILDNDVILKNIIISKKLKKETDDETMMAIQDYICNGVYLPGTDYAKKILTYTGDIEENKTYEFWQFPFETVESMRGDCEDGAILIAALAINAGIPPYKVKVAAGDVTNRFYLNPEAPSIEEVPLGKYEFDGVSEGGHAYCIYLASDNEWRIIDWCYYEDSKTPMLEKPLSKDGGFGKCYLDTWFTFNNQFAWNQTSMKIEAAKVGYIYKKEELQIKTK
jgi:hypothetical protein